MSTLRYQYDGTDKIAEVGAATPIVVQRRYVFGPGVDEPLVMYEGADTAKKYWLVADERGSVVAVTGDPGFSATNTYDEYGRPGPGNFGLFQYTGQAYIAATGLYDYKARVYDPGLGRFLQTDPIGYGDCMNLYGYVGGDPVNATDPSGLRLSCQKQADSSRVTADDPVISSPSYLCFELQDPFVVERGEGGGGGQRDKQPSTDVVVTARKPAKKSPSIILIPFSNL